jgi:hypothetical protein
MYGNCRENDHNTICSKCGMQYDDVFIGPGTHGCPNCMGDEDSHSVCRPKREFSNEFALALEYLNLIIGFGEGSCFNQNPEVKLRKLLPQLDKKELSMLKSYFAKCEESVKTAKEILRGRKA